MKNNYSLLMKKIASLFVILCAFSINAQDIEFTFENPQNTNEGGFDYYEVDVMIATVNASGSFKLGSGQLYFNYNTAAFGLSVFDNSNIEVSQDNVQGYIAGQNIDAAAAAIYSSFTTNDNTDSRVSWSFSQFFSSNTFAADNVTSVPTKLCHLKFKYSNVNEMPMVMFEDGTVFDDQFETACGGIAGGPFEAADCGAQPGVEILNDSFDSSGNTLSNSEFDLQSAIRIYPNPVKDILTIEGDLQNAISLKLYGLSGQLILELKDNFNTIDMSQIETGIYFVKLNTGKDTSTFKVIKE